MLNIAWYARDGHLDLFPQIAARLAQLGADFASHYVCHHSVDQEHLRNTYGVEDPWVVGDYLASYRRSLDTSDRRLREVQAAYGPIPLRRCLWAEASELKFSAARLIWNLLAHLDFWEHFLSTNKIDMLVTERPSIVSTCVAWLVCQKHNIEYVDFIDVPPLASRMVLSSSWEGYFDGLEEAFNKQSMDQDSRDYSESAQYLEKMKQGPRKTAEAMARLEADRKKGALVTHLAKAPELIPHAPALLRRVQRKAQGYYLYQSPTKRLGGWARVYVNKLHLKLAGVFDQSFQPENERYFLLPLHSKREWSNYTWMGLKYADPIGMVREVAACLPLGSKLYVKEHTAGFGERPVSFYRQLTRVPQVRLIGPDADTNHLIRNSSGVVTLGSTMGFEALMMDKPTTILAEPWYRNLPGVYRGHRPEGLAELLQNADDLAVPTEAEKLRMLYALFQISFEGVKWPHPDTLTAENVTNLARALKQRLGGVEYKSTPVIGEQTSGDYSTPVSNSV